MRRLAALVLLLALGLAHQTRAQTIPATANITASDGGTCATAGACLTVNVPSNTTASSVIEIDGTFSATLQFEAVAKIGGTFVSIAATPLGGGSAVTSATGTGAWRVTASGVAQIRVRCSAFTSGTAVAAITLSTGSSGTGGSGGGGGGFTAGQDLTGTSSSQTVVGLETIPLPTLALATGCIFDNNGTLQLITGCNSGISSLASYFTAAGGVLQINGQSTGAGAFASLAPTVTGQGDLMVGTAGLQWTIFGHNTSGTALYSQNSSGVGSWVPTSNFLSGALTNTHIFVGNNLGAAIDVAMSGDCSMANTGAINCLSTNGVSFAPSATTDTTNASNIASGSLANARLNTVDAPHGGSGIASPTAHCLLMGEGASIFNLLCPGLTGQVVQANNAGDYTIASSGLSGRSVAGTSDTILCDSATALRDRLTTIQYSSASATAITVPQAGSSGCSSNFSFAAFNLNAAGTDTFTPTTSTVNGQATLGMGQNVWCAFSSPDNSNYIARCATWVKPGTNMTASYNADGSITLNSAASSTPCTSTALSFQINSGGAFGCAPDFTLSTHTFLMGASGLVDLSAGVAAAFKAPVAAGATASANGVFNYDSTAGNSHFRVNGADAIGVGEAAALTAGFIPKATDSTHGLQTASLCDDGHTTANVFTCTDSAGAQFTSQVAVGTAPACTAGTAGAICETEGTAFTNVASTAGMYPDSTSHEFVGKTNGASSGGIMVRVQPGQIHQTAQTASIGTATLCAASAGACNTAGQYHVHFDFIATGTTCSSVTAGSVTFNLTWTDSNSTTHSAITIGVYDQKTAGFTTAFHFNTSLATAGASGDFNISTNGAIIQYSTTYAACTTGTGTYQLDAVVTRLQ